MILNFINDLWTCDYEILHTTNYIIIISVISNQSNDDKNTFRGLQTQMNDSDNFYWLAGSGVKINNREIVCASFV